ncbi:hypothetical protein DPMN_021638 [Dreissena polymorpha]|uniref:Uncharacterized protein n=1 Tax=Dreissena polymorpha TaxID=45954 RepID=A0A9D4SB83_DREPO|nr:hypothetical protein DPMN_021638 [Dreissena polymorpha]
MWTAGRRTKTNPKTSPEQSGIFQLVREINKINCSITRKTAPPPYGHVFLPIRTICGLVCDIYKTNLFTKFHDDWAQNVTSRVFTSFFYKYKKIAPPPPPPGNHVIQLTETIFEPNSRIKETNVLTKFHENVFTYFHYIHIEKNAPPTGGHVFSPIWTIFYLVQDIIKTNVLTNFHDDWAKIVTSRVFTRKTAPPTGGHIFQRTKTTFYLNQHIIKANILSKFHLKLGQKCDFYRVHMFSLYTFREKCPAHWRPCFFLPIWTIFKLVRDINKTNVLSNFHDDWAKIVTSRVKTAPPTGSHVFQRTGTTFELNQHIIKANILTNFDLDRDIIGTNLLTKFHEDRTINVASSVFTNKCGRTDGRTTDGRRTNTGHKSSPEQSGELKRNNLTYMLMVSICDHAVSA